MAARSVEFPRDWIFIGSSKKFFQLRRVRLVPRDDFPMRQPFPYPERFKLRGDLSRTAPDDFKNFDAGLRIKISLTLAEARIIIGGGG